MTTQKTIFIDPLSVCSLRLELVANGNSLGLATGFVVQRDATPLLITNWHVVSGRNSETNEVVSDTGAEPDELRIVHHSTQQLGSWTIKVEQLFDRKGRPRWIEHPQGRTVDLVALPLKDIDLTVQLFPLDLKLAAVDIRVQPATPVSIIGYPFGLATAGAWPIWKTGHIASDPDLDYDARPAFLIDATTRGGMSGSPVVFRSQGSYLDSSGAMVLGGPQTRLLGVYSGRIHGQAEIGRVWRPSALEELLARRKPS